MKTPMLSMADYTPKACDTGAYLKSTRKQSLPAPSSPAAAAQRGMCRAHKKSRENSAERSSRHHKRFSSHTAIKQAL